MNKREEREKRNQRLSEAIEDQPEPKRGVIFPITKKVDPNFNGVTLPKKEKQTYEDIAKTMRIEIPVCYVKPYNGRIFVKSIAADEFKTESGIILPYKMRDGKDGSMKNVRRYFVVAFDQDDIPPSIAKDLYVGKEVNPYIVTEAEEWRLPIVIDWKTGVSFEVIHYTELAGGSMVQPEEVTG
ncbi:MAG: hypothetical protein GX567_09560 [Clostridia bacterium]|jgi:hypothetical protein|nr:hypothetical protein [Clostridia bacterium]